MQMQYQNISELYQLIKHDWHKLLRATLYELRLFISYAQLILTQNTLQILRILMKKWCPKLKLKSQQVCCFYFWLKSQQVCCFYQMRQHLLH